MDIGQARTIFAASGVTTALIVDDVFDDFEPYEAADLERAFALFESKDDVPAAFEAAGGEVPVDPDDLGAKIAADAALATHLQGARDGEAGALQELGNALYGRVADDRAGRLKPIEELVAVLNQLGVAATTVGSNGPGNDAPRYPLIFMDYYLGSKGTPSIERSRERIEEIVSHYGPHEMPLVVLMSSELKKEKEASKFRERAQLLGSQFKFAKKEEFEDDNLEFVSSLAAMVKFLPQTRTIGAFVKAWSGALNEAIIDFRKGVGKLDLQDYFQIRTKLGADGAGKFGEHVSGLFDGYLRRLVEDQPALRSATAAMNALSFQGRPPAPFTPSETVVQMADAAAFQSLPDIPPPAPGKLDVELGDVYLRETGTRTKRVKSACVVISQACDLEHGKTQTVLLLNGIVTKRSSAKADRAGTNRPIIRTDLFLHDSENLIIDWDASDLTAVQVGEFQEWMKRMTFEKVARLRPMQALALQQRFATHLTRVGLPETPPSYRYPNVEVMISRGTVKERLLGPIKAGDLACVIGDEKPEAVLQEALLGNIAKLLNEIDGTNLDQAQWDEAKDLLSNWEKRERLQTLPLKAGKAQVGNIAVLDRETAMGPGEGMPAGVWLSINLYG
jgi:hypothetical protein